MFHNTKLSKRPLTLSKKTGKSISSITFNLNDVVTNIRSLDLNKDHGHNMISIHLKI